MPTVPRFPVPADGLKVCSKCGETKPLDAYYVHDKGTGRLFSWCKTCHGRGARERYRRNPQKYAAIRRSWARGNAERDHANRQTWRERNLPDERAKERLREAKPERLASRAAYRQAKRTERLAYNAAYRAAHRDEIRASSAAYRARNRDLIARRLTAWRAAHPNRLQDIARRSKRKHKDTVNASTHRRRARIKGNGGSWTAAEWRALKAACDRRCLLCGRQEPEIRLTVDHVIPVSVGGPNTIDNIQPLCQSCNSTKHRRTLDLRPAGAIGGRAATR